MEKHQIVVTDPCYIMSEADWDACCKEAEARQDEHKQEWSEAFNEIVSRKLTALSGHEAYATDTGFGDWNNDIDGQAFCADSGMVCVCYLTEDMEARLNEYPNQDLAAIIEVEGEIKVEFNYDHPDWTVVTIEDEAGNHYQSFVPIDEEEEDEDY